MGSPVTRVMNFILSIFSLLHPSILNLGSGMGQTGGQTETDRQTTAINALCPTLCRRGHNSGLAGGGLRSPSASSC